MFKYYSNILVNLELSHKLYYNIKLNIPKIFLKQNFWEWDNKLKNSGKS